LVQCRAVLIAQTLPAGRGRLNPVTPGVGHRLTDAISQEPPSVGNAGVLYRARNRLNETTVSVAPRHTSNNPTVIDCGRKWRLSRETGPDRGIVEQTVHHVTPMPGCIMATLYRSIEMFTFRDAAKNREEKGILRMGGCYTAGISFA